MTWKQPVSDPLFVDVWSRELFEEDHDKPTALGTPFRFSDALNCSRRMVFDALGVEKSDPIDPAGIHVTTIGTILHEKVQDAIGRKYPDAKFEVVSGSELISGSADGVCLVDGHGLLLELKTVGQYPFHKAIGMSGMGYRAKRVSPEGPRVSAIAQAGLNALHNGCDTVVVMYIALEAISKNVAERLGFSMYERFTAEWEIPMEVWKPLALDEMRRVSFLNELAQDGQLPSGDYFDDQKWEWESISPEDQRPKWVCDYCPHRTTCVAHENGIEVL